MRSGQDANNFQLLHEAASCQSHETRLGWRAIQHITDGAKDHINISMSVNGNTLHRGHGAVICRDRSCAVTQATTVLIQALPKHHTRVNMTYR